MGGCAIHVSGSSAVKRRRVGGITRRRKSNGKRARAVVLFTQLSRGRTGSRRTRLRDMFPHSPSPPPHSSLPMSAGETVKRELRARAELRWRRVDVAGAPYVLLSGRAIHRVVNAQAFGEGDAWYVFPYTGSFPPSPLGRDHPPTVHLCAPEPSYVQYTHAQTGAGCRHYAATCVSSKPLTTVCTRRGAGNSPRALMPELRPQRFQRSSAL